jgi:SNF2 family DNA or RNA helicase
MDIPRLDEGPHRIELAQTSGILTVTNEDAQSSQLTVSSGEFDEPSADLQRSLRAEAIARLLYTGDHASKASFDENGAFSWRVQQCSQEPSRLPSGCSDLNLFRHARRPLNELLQPLVFGTSSRQQPSLMPYQEYGANWLETRDKAILADDMGLGKTAQAIRALDVGIASGSLLQAVVLCPKSLLANWEAELEKWAPHLTVARVVPAARIREKAWRTLLGRTHVLLTTYEQLARAPSNLSVELLIADEAHRLRKAGTKTTAAVVKLSPNRLWLLTGTPIERDKKDLATLLSILSPTRFSPAMNSLHLSSLRAQARQFILRRTKERLLPELPAVTEQTEILELAPAQQEIYAREAALMYGGHVKNFVAGLSKLRAICDLDAESMESSKLDRAIEILSDVRENGEQAVVFSYTLAPLYALHERCAIAFETPTGTSLLTGSMSSEQREEVVTHFQDDKDCTALLCSMRAASEGLNLVNANNVIFINEWWNPSTNAQARDRVVRIGQKRGVFVWYLRCRGTIDDLLGQRVIEKKDLFDHLVGKIAQSGDQIRAINDLLERDVDPSEIRLDA